MKKTLLATALLAGFAGAAHAQSSVTLYGLVDAGFDYRKVDGKTISGIDSGLMSQSRFGLRGSEDLGNGLKAIFTLENGFTVDDGQQTHGRLFGRYAYVGLDSNSLGRLTLGRTTNLAFMWAAGIVNPFGLNFSTASIGSTFAYNDAVMGGGRVNNSVYYYSPSFYGVQAAVGYSFNAFANPTSGETEAPQSGKNNRMIDAGLKYENGPIKGVLTYQQVESPLPGTKTFRNLTLGATYDFGVAAVFAGYAKAKNITGAYLNGYNSVVATGGQFTDDNAYTLGASAPIGPGKLYAAWQKATKSKVDGWALGYTYDLSKRTNLYAFYADNDVRNFDQNRDMTYRQLGVGLQHRF
ncbi:porin [Pigmentiphaga sp.]|uniref:porin n=1 Tax=Pigmentiphaga sp. TaxID=1977564 RepID=UPI00128D8E5C|nr:porin [Pigmentiphaga sp.]MPS29080.1 porin [Alcaligenaceae bacterium SAGV5]MPS52210.1 porin [Alcaligenaceae bacterium SAGV3]MPT57983.1 porin [Alcaligenaceae bacterium]